MWITEQRLLETRNAIPSAANKAALTLTMEYSFRQLSIEDMPALQDLRRSAPHEETLGRSEDFEYASTVEIVKRDVIAPSRTFGCFDGAKLVGACSIVERFYSFGDNGESQYEGVPTSLLVEVEHRGRQIGRKLVDHCLKSTKAWRVVIFNLIVRCPRESPGTPARHLYESFGFAATTDIGREEDPPSEYVNFTMRALRSTYVLRRREQRHRAFERTSARVHLS